MWQNIMLKCFYSKHLLKHITLPAILFIATWIIAAPGLYGGEGVWMRKGPYNGSHRLLVIDPSNPQTVYVSTTNDGAFKTTDGGSSWTRLYMHPTYETPPILALDPSNPQTVYMGAGPAWIYRSTDGGINWRKLGIADGYNFDGVSNLIIDPSDPQTIIASTSERIFRSTDGGSTWPVVHEGRTYELAIAPSNPRIFYACIDNGYVIKSTDGGSSWMVAGTKGPYYAKDLVIDPSNPQIMYADSDEELYKSTDGGYSWTSKIISSTIHSIYSLEIDPSNPQIIYAGTDSDVFKSTDEGDTWILSNTGMRIRSSVNVYSLAINPSTPQTLYAGTNSDGGLFKSTDSGSSWKLIRPGGRGITGINALVMDPSTSQTLYVGTSAGILKSTDSGDDWLPMNAGLLTTKISVIAIDPVNPQTLYTGTDSGVFKSTDGGVSWIRHWLANSVAVSALAIEPMAPQTIYAGMELYGVAKSTDGGSTWKGANSGLTDKNIVSLVTDPVRTQTIYVGTDGGAFKSTDGGGTWSEINTGLFNVASYMPYAVVSHWIFDPLDPQLIFAGTDSGVFKSTNAGNSWNSVDSGPSRWGISGMALDVSMPHALYAGTFKKGIFKSTDGGSNWIKLNELPESSQVVDVLNIIVDPNAPYRVFVGTSNKGVWLYSPSCSKHTTWIAKSIPETCDTGGEGSIQVGYATVSTVDGATPYGTAVFSLKQNGITITETGVPASPPTTKARIFIDYREQANSVPGRVEAGKIDINTGIAFVNYGSATANVTYRLRDLSGYLLATGHMTIAAGHHIARFIDQLQDLAPDFSLPSNFKSAICFASLEVSSTQPLSILSIRMTTNQRNEILYTTTPMADDTHPQNSDSLYFPQFADGGGYTTTLVLLNTSDQVETGTFEIRDNNGSLMTVREAGGGTNSSFRYSIEPNGAFRFQTDGSPLNGRAGWLRLIPDAGTSTPVGSGIFGYNPVDILVTESGVPSATATTHASIYVDLTGNHNTGLAIANIADTDATLRMQTRLIDGGERFVLTSLRLPAGGHDAKFVDQLITGITSGFAGILTIESTTPFAALTIRSLDNERHDFLITAFPIADVTQPAPSPLVFPQIADGEGYITQLILLSPSGGSDISLSFYGEDGQVLDLTK
jgi:photosystem II stability/assembly factor-like uncharacterized protein